MKKNIIRLNELQLKWMIKESVTRLLSENRPRLRGTRYSDGSYGCQLRKIISGSEFLDYLTDEQEQKLATLNPDVVAKLRDGEFECYASYYHSPGNYYNPPSDDFDIEDDGGLGDLIDQIKDPQIKQKFKEIYDRYMEDADWETPYLDDEGPEREDCYPDDLM